MSASGTIFDTYTALRFGNTEMTSRLPMVISFAPNCINFLFATSIWKLSSSVARIYALPSISSARHSTICDNKSDKLAFGHRHAPHTANMGPQAQNPMCSLVYDLLTDHIVEVHIVQVRIMDSRIL